MTSVQSYNTVSRRSLGDHDNSEATFWDAQNLRVNNETASKHSESFDIETLKNEIKQLKHATHERSVDSLKSKITPEEAENEFHEIDLIFGDALDYEVERVIPELIKRFGNDKSNAHFLLQLQNKKRDLQALKTSTAGQRASGEMPYKNYITILERVLDFNKMILQRATNRKLSASDISRIEKRIQIIKNEIGKPVSKNPTGPEPVKSSSQKVLPPLQKPKVVTVSSNSLEHSIRKESEALAPQVVTAKRTLPGLDQTSYHLGQKIIFHNYVIEHFSKYYFKERSSDISALVLKVDRMKARLDYIKKNPKEVTIEQVDKEFPNLSQTFIIGMSYIERNKKIEEVIREIQGDIKKIRSSALLEVYKSHYLPVMKKLIEAKASKYATLPTFVKKTFSVPSFDVDRKLEGGELLIKIVKIIDFKPKRHFSLQYEFQYENQTIIDKTHNSNNDGNIDYERKFILDSGKLIKSFCNDKIIFSLYKKKFLSSSHVGASVGLSLEGLRHNFEIKKTIEFELPGHESVYADIEVHAHKAIERPLKDVLFYIIEKQVPEIKATQPVEVQRPEAVDEKRSATTIEGSTASKTSTPLKAREQQANIESSGGPPLQSRTTMVNSKLMRFPILRAYQKKELEAIIINSKLPKIFLNYQEKIFSMTFIEKFIKELKVQISQFASQNDLDTKKEAERILAACMENKTSLSEQMDSGKMAPADYKLKIDGFIKMDEAVLNFFEKTGFQESITFIKNRMKIMSDESAEVAQFLLEDKKRHSN